MRVRKFGFIVLLLSVTSITFPQTEKVKLEHKLKAGQKWTRTETGKAFILFQLSDKDSNMIEEDSNMIETIEMVKELTTETRITHKQEVASVTNEGVFEIKRTGKVEETEIAPIARKTNTRHLPPITFWQTRTGKLITTNVQPFAPPKLDDLDDPFSYILDQMPPLLPLPDNAINVGETWTSVHRLKNPNDEDLKVTGTHRLFAVDKRANIAWVVSEINVPLEFRWEQGSRKWTINGKFNMRQFTKFSLIDGKEVSSTTTATLDLVIDLDSDAGKLTGTVTAIEHSSATTQ